MPGSLKEKLIKTLRWSEKYTKTDMVYLFTGGFWLTFGQVFASAAAFVLSVAFANLLPKADYGTYRYVLSLFSIFAIFSLSGTNTSIIQAVARGFEGSFWKIFKAKIFWSLLGSLVSLSFSIYYFLNKNYLLSIALVIIAVTLPWFESSSLYQSLLYGRKNFKLATKYSNWTRLISLAIMLGCLWLTDNVLLILVSYLVPQIILQLIFTRLTLKQAPLQTPTEDKALSFGVNLSAMEVLKIIAGQIDKILIFHYLGAIQLALYAFVVAPISQIKSLILNVKSLALPKLSTADGQEIHQHFPEKIKRLEIVVSLCVLAYILLAPWLFRLFFPQYLEVVNYTRVYSLTLLFLPRSLLSTVLVAKMKQKELYAIRIIGPILRIIILFVALRYFGLWGMVWGSIISEASQFFIYNFFFNKAFEKTPSNPGV